MKWYKVFSGRRGVYTIFFQNEESTRFHYSVRFFECLLFIWDRLLTQLLNLGVSTEVFLSVLFVLSLVFLFCLWYIKEGLFSEEDDL